jgi:twitching motility protein PilT
VAVCEVLRMTGRVRDKIIDPHSALDLATVIAEGAYDGMQTFEQALYAHVAAGRVSLEDALAAATSPHDFKLLVEAQGRRGVTMADVVAAA